MQRIKLEVLTELHRCTASRLWVIELIEDADGNFCIHRYYGKENAAKFIKKVDLVTEHIEEGLRVFENKVKNKLDNGDYRKFKNGEGSNSAALLTIFRPKPIQPQAVAKAAVLPEYRKLRL